MRAASQISSADGGQKPEVVIAAEKVGVRAVHIQCLSVCYIQQALQPPSVCDSVLMGRQM